MSLVFVAKVTCLLVDLLLLFELMVLHLTFDFLQHFVALFTLIFLIQVRLPSALEESLLAKLIVVLRVSSASHLGFSLTVEVNLLLGSVISH